MTNQPSVCTDPGIRLEMLSGMAPRREAALERFVRGAFGYLFHALTGYAANKKWNCPADKIHETCADAYVAFKKNTGKTGFSFQGEDACGYFFQIARNILSQRLDFNAPQIKEFDPQIHGKTSSDTPQSRMEQEERHRLLREAMKKLNPEERTILTLYADAYKVAEIAQVMQYRYEDTAAAMRAAGLDPTPRDLWTEPYTKVRLQRARTKLRELLDPLLDA